MDASKLSKLSAVLSVGFCCLPQMHTDSQISAASAQALGVNPAAAVGLEGALAPLRPLGWSELA